MDAEERQEYVEELAAEREQLKQQIDEVSKKRRKYLDKSKPQSSEGLDDAMLEAIDEQL